LTEFMIAGALHTRDKNILFRCPLKSRGARAVSSEINS
jgi:hypothetical protein